MYQSVNVVENEEIVGKWWKEGVLLIGPIQHEPILFAIHHNGSLLIKRQIIPFKL